MPVKETVNWAYKYGTMSAQERRSKDYLRIVNRMLQEPLGRHLSAHES